MAVTKRLYVFSIIAAVLAVAAIFLVVKYWDDSRLSSIENRVRESQEETDSTRLLFLYNQLMPEKNAGELCNLTDFTLELQMDKGFMLIQQMREYEKANLLSNYEETRKRYYLSNFEMWLYSVQQNNACAAVKGNKTTALFFTDTKTFCSDCLVQGDILNDLRASCANLRVITLASDLGIAPIDFLTKKYGIQKSPAILVDGKLLQGLQSKDALNKAFGC